METYLQVLQYMSLIGLKAIIKLSWSKTFYFVMMATTTWPLPTPAWTRLPLSMLLLNRLFL